jgi:hypothetical protein
MTTNIATWKIELFQTSLVYGVAILILYIIVPTMLIGNELRLAKKSDDTSGQASVMSAVYKSVFYIVMWILFISLIAMLLIGAAGRTDTSPAFGAWSFFNIDWLNSTTLSSLDKTSKVYIDGGDKLLEEARMIVLYMSWAKFVEIVMLGLMIIFTTAILFNLQLSKMRRVQDEIDGGKIVVFLILAVLGFGMFHLEIKMIDIFLSNLIKWGNNFNGTHLLPDKVDIYSDFWSFLKKGLEIVSNKH